MTGHHYLINNRSYFIRQLVVVLFLQIDEE